MKKNSSALIIIILIGLCTNDSYAQQNFRPPAYPLIASDPYFSIWSFNDTLYNGPTHHWTGKTQSLQGIIRVDGNSMYFLGKPIPEYDAILPLSSKDNGRWRYTFNQPGNQKWYEPDYNASSWNQTKGAFSDHKNAPNKWTSHDIWVRRTFELTRANLNHLYLKLHHDDNVTVYINGVLAYKKIGWVSSPVLLKMNDKVEKALQKGSNVLAIHCVNTAGGAYLDAGLVEKKVSQLRVPDAKQTSVKVTATQTIYNINCDNVALQVTFTTPKLLGNPDLVSRPANYVTFRTHSLDSQKHKVQLYFSAAGNLAVNTKDQKVVWRREKDQNLSVMRVGTKTQNVLGRKGDNVRVDWGYFYLAAPKKEGLSTSIDASNKSIKNFVDNGQLTIPDDKQMPRAAGKNPVTLALTYDMGRVGTTNIKRHIILAYDELYPIEFFHQKLKAWWKRDAGMTALKMLNQSDNDYADLITKCDHFDSEMARKATEAGGPRYAKLCELAYRQALAACKLAQGPDGKPYYFTKENFSNGDISTVDVIYPTSPVMLNYNANLLKALMNPVFYYSESGKWIRPYSPHDLGTYPIANGRKREESMPIEESGNMIIMSAAISEVDGNASYAKSHWKVLTQWAHYLLQYGMDPQNQLTTDDFAGRTAHNANLSVKAIMGIASYGKMAGMLGKKQIAKEYVDTARAMAKKWIKLDKEGNHYKLTFTRKNSWSQKYNLVWDKVFNWNIFPDKVARQEIAYYLTRQNKYGLPLDNRATYTKSDWINWTATLAGNKTTFEKFIGPLFKAFSETKDRVPMTDWYQTTDASQVGFQARSVVGGYFMKMLDQKMEK